MEVPSNILSAFPGIDPKELLQKGIAQLCKDFTLQGLNLTIDPYSTTYAEAIVLISRYLEEIERAKNNHLTTLLYQVDISPNQLKTLAANDPKSPPQTIIAEGLLIRCMMKVYFRMNQAE